MTLYEAIILGIIQGITEFLPISSSGHLAVAQALFGITEGNLAIDIVLHLGTFFAIVIAYHEAVFGLIRELFGMIHDLFTEKSFCLDKSKYRRYIPYILLASLPAAAAGILLDDYIEAALQSLFFVFLMFQVTAIILFAGERIGRNNNLDIEKIGPVKAFVIGLFQMTAILPGLSRSGTTMTGGLVCGLKKEDALEMSFLMALPAIAGSVLLKIDGIVMILQSNLVPIFAGFVCSFVFGYLSILFFKLVVKRFSAAIFSIYLFVIGQVMLFTILRR